MVGAAAKQGIGRKLDPVQVARLENERMERGLLGGGMGAGECR